MTIRLRLQIALVSFVLVPVLLSGCGGEDQPSQEASAPAEEEVSLPTKLEATRDALEVSGYAISTQSLGSDEVAALYAEADGDVFEGGVLVLEAAEVEGLSETELAQLIAEDLGTDSPIGDAEALSEESCGRYRIVGADEHLQQSVVSALCG